MFGRKQISIGALSAVFCVCIFALPAAAQVEFDGVHLGMSGDVSAGYDGDLSNQGGASSHGLSAGGNGFLSGSYYNPNFLSFSVQPYYNRSQANSDSQSIFDSSGYSGNVQIFGGSHFPGTINFNQLWDSTGTFGIPGVAGLTTKDNSRNFGIGWSELVPGLPTLGVSYSRGSGSGTVLGSEEQNETTTQNFAINSTYRLAGWNVGGGFTHSIIDSSSTGFLENGELAITDSSTNSYQFSTSHSLDLLHGGFNANFNRIDYNATYAGEMGGADHGTTDTAFGVINATLGKFPIVGTVSYTDNLYGSFEEQILSSGGTAIENNLSPKSHQLLASVATSYPILPHLVASGFVSRQEDYIAGQSYGLTQLGANVHYDFGRRFKGLTATVGVIDSADQQGNTGAVLIANVNYTHNIGQWELGAWFDYDESVQTLLATYQMSTMSYSGQIHRRLPRGFFWNIGGGGGRSVFVQTPGVGSHGEGVNSSLSWRRFSLAGVYSQSNGTSVLTPTGLVGMPVPVVSNNLVAYTGKSHGVSFGATPLRGMSLSLSYNKANSNMLGTGSSLSSLTSNTETELVSGLLTYNFRKVLFQAGAIQFHQGISASNTLPSVVTSYYFGISRWFKAF